MRDAIQARLTEIEESHCVRILYACEAGSRAWGFPSADSDYDVRFIFVRPTDRLLVQGLPWAERHNGLKDQIDDRTVKELDIVGWSLAKTLGLLVASNPPLYEWLGSPIVYRASHEIERLSALAVGFYTPRKASYHYAHMAENNWKQYLHGETVWTKKYFYVLRPLLAALWLAEGRGEVPTAFDALVTTLIVDMGTKRAIADLLARKLTGDELADGPHITVLDAYIENNLARILVPPPPTVVVPPPPLDELAQFYLDVVRGRMRR